MAPECAATPTVYRQQWRKARWHYHCDECAGDIPRRGRYSYVTGCWDYQWQQFRECPKCWATRQAWHDVTGHWPSHGNLQADVIDVLRDDRQPERNRAFGSRLRTYLGKYGPQRPVASSGRLTAAA